MSWVTPRTWAAGEIVTAALLNAQLRDNLTYVMGGQTWTSLTLVNSWVAFGAPYATPAFRQFGDVVEIRGAVKNGVENSVIANLPAGSRPNVTLIFPAWMTEGTAQGWAYVSVAANGDVKHTRIGASAPLAPANDFVGLDTIRFSLI